ncbi:MAG: serine/threonine-protein kinase [Xenococcus sp. MO_188.B8]|nr:serine/threonine-protein kinase [Xenococcus sp. MO_188.B8]
MKRNIKIKKPWQPGYKFRSRPYEIKEKLGNGGFGIAYKVNHIHLEFFSVIKTPNPELQGTRKYLKYIRGFEKEAKILAKLCRNPHPNIVHVIDYFEENGLPCMLMSFIEGEDLKKVVLRGDSLSEAEAVEYIRQIGSALIYCHQNNIIHRDVKPGNIMVRPDHNIAMLIDFGIATEIAITLTNLSYTANPGYTDGFAPWEQMIARGDIDSRTPQVDIYSLAASLYFLVTKKIPTSCLARKYKNQQLESPQQLNPALSDNINKAILQGMEIEPENRPERMQEWLDLLLCSTRKSRTFDLSKQLEKESQSELKLTNGQKSNSNDQSQLIEGSEMQEAINWAENNQLNNNQFDYLIDSIIWDSPRMEKEAFRPCWVTNDANDHETVVKPLYEKVMNSWFTSDCQDKSQLIEGQELQEAINWAENNRLNNHQFDYLIESLVWDSQRMEKQAFRSSLVPNETVVKPLYEKVMNSWFTSDCQDKSQLLCGLHLQIVLALVENKDLSQQEFNFLIDSLVWDMYDNKTVSAEEEREKTEVAQFLKELWPQLQTKTKHPYKVIQEVLSWTECQPFLTKKICQLICDSNSPIPEGKEEQQIEQIVQTYFNQDSQDQEIVQHFQVVCEHLLTNENYDSFWLLLEYRKILLQETITDAQIQKVLLNTRLIVNQQGKLKIHNCIYQSIFNQEWVARMLLEDKRPYAKKLLVWLDSNCQDQSQFLNERELQEALQWTIGKGDRLRPQEKKFIALSQALKFKKI